MAGQMWVKVELPANNLKRKENFTHLKKSLKISLYIIIFSRQDKK